MAEIVHSSSGYKYTNSGSSIIEAGTVVVNSKLFGVAAATIAVGATGWIETTGVWRIACGSSMTASIGDIAYWDATNANITATKGTNLPVGYFVAAVASGATACLVRLGVGQEAAAAQS